MALLLACCTVPATRPSGAAGAGTQGAATQGAATQGADTQGAGTQGAATQSAGTQSAGTQGADTQSAGTQGADTKGAGTQSAGTQSADTKGAATAGVTPGEAPRTHARALARSGDRPPARPVLGPGEVARLPSRFGAVVVFDDGPYRCLAFNNKRVVQSCRSRQSHLDYRFEYVSLMLSAALVRLEPALASEVGVMGRHFRPVRRAVVLGLGGAALPTLLAHYWPGIRVDTVEIDPGVVQAASRWFGYRTRPGETLYLQDAAQFVRRADRTGRYDLVLVDCYGASFIPKPLQSKSFLASLGALLAPGGLIVANLWMTHPRYAALVRRYASIYRTVWTMPGKASGNAMVLASRQHMRLVRARLADQAAQVSRVRRLPLNLGSHLRRLRPVPRPRR